MQRTAMEHATKQLIQIGVLISLLLLLAGSGTAAQETARLYIIVEADGTLSIDSITPRTTTTRIDSGSVNASHSLRVEARNTTDTYYTKTVPLAFTGTTPTGEQENLSSVAYHVNVPLQENTSNILFFINGERVQSLSTEALVSGICKGTDNTCFAFCDSKNLDLDCTCGDNVCQASFEKGVCTMDCQPITWDTPGKKVAQIVDQHSRKIAVSALILGTILVVFAVKRSLSRVRGTDAFKRKMDKASLRQ